MNERNATCLVHGSTLNIYKTGSATACFPSIILEGKPITVKLEKDSNYDFILEGNNTHASSVVRNLKITPLKNEINIVQLTKQLPERLNTPLNLTQFYAVVEGKNVELKDGLTLPSPLTAKVVASISSRAGAVLNLKRGMFSAKLAFDTSPSSIKVKHLPFISGIESGHAQNIPNGEFWENIFEFNLRGARMGGKKKVDFTLIAHDVAGNRLEYHTLVNFDSPLSQESKNNDTIIKNVHCNIKTSYSNMNIYSLNKNLYYFPNFSFEVEGEYAVEIVGMELFRRTKKDSLDEPFTKVSQVLYDRAKVGTHVIIDTYGGLFEGKEYEYKIRALLQDGSYAESKNIPAKLISPFEVILLSPDNHSTLTHLSNFSFKIASDRMSAKELFSKQMADYLLFGLMITSHSGKKEFFNSFKYWLDEKHEGDERLEILINRKYKSFKSLKESDISLRKFSLQDFVELDIETGKITIKKDSLLYTNTFENVGYLKSVPYYWDVCAIEDTSAGLKTTPCGFYKEENRDDMYVVLNSRANMTAKAYTSNGKFSFNINDGNNNSGIIQNSYIVKAHDNCSFAFLSSLKAKVAGRLKISDDIDETYYQITSDSNIDILSNILAQEGIIAAEHDVKMKMIEPIPSVYQELLQPFSIKEVYDPPVNDPLLKSCCYSLYLTDSYKAYNELEFGQNKVIAGIIDTGINISHEDFFDLQGESIIKNIRSEDLYDTNGHGTHCAGIMAGIGNNDKGIAGVSWKNTKLFPFKFPDDNSALTIYKNISDFADYIKKERDENKLEQKTVPFNMSFGSSAPTLLALEAINKCLECGVLPVVAAGNDGSHHINYPAAYPGVIAVASSNAQDEVSSFSTKGEYVSIAAPGESIMSCWKQERATYHSLDGTSMAAPFVSGAICYLMSFNLELQPGQIKTLLEESADKISGDEEFNTTRGYGRINLYKAAKRVIEKNLPKDRFFKKKLVITASPYKPNNMVCIYNNKGICVAIGHFQHDGKAEFRGLLPGKYKAKLNTVSKVIEEEFEIPQNAVDDVIVPFN